MPEFKYYDEEEPEDLQPWQTDADDWKGGQNQDVVPQLERWNDHGDTSPLPELNDWNEANPDNTPADAVFEEGSIPSSPSDVLPAEALLALHNDTQQPITGADAWFAQQGATADLLHHALSATDPLLTEADLANTIYAENIDVALSTRVPGLIELDNR